MGGREQSMANSENEKKPEKIKQTETRIHMLTMNEKKPTSHKYIMGPLLQQIYTGFYVQYRFEKSCIFIHSLAQKYLVCIDVRFKVTSHCKARQGKAKYTVPDERPTASINSAHRPL